jgi:hypothetical protein
MNPGLPLRRTASTASRPRATPAPHATSGRRGWDPEPTTRHRIALRGSASDQPAGPREPRSKIEAFENRVTIRCHPFEHGSAQAPRRGRAGRLGTIVGLGSASAAGLIPAAVEALFGAAPSARTRSTLRPQPPGFDMSEAISPIRWARAPARTGRRNPHPRPALCETRQHGFQMLSHIHLFVAVMTHSVGIFSPAFEA